MKFSIRKKTIILLAAVALLPLLTSLVTLAIGWYHSRINSFGQGILSLASAEAVAREVSVADDIRQMQLLLETRAIQDYVKTQPADESSWASVLDNPASSVLTRVKATDPRIKSILLTDARGRLIAATDRMGDLHCADEEWWKHGFNRAKGQIHISVESGHGASGWSLDVSIPVISKGTVVGICKIMMPLEQWVRPHEDRLIDSDIMLVDSDSTVIYRSGVTPLSAKLADWQGPISTPGVSGWRISGDEIQAFTPLQISGETGGYKVQFHGWKLVVFASKAGALGPVYWMTTITAGVGLLVVAGLFLLGVWLIDRSLVQRIMAMNSAIARVSRGDLSGRVELPRPRLLGRDELDDLGAAFTKMIEQVQKSTELLKSANQLKSDFIRIAGHELRTPVSYILGMARLMKESTDADKLLFAVQSMGAKAMRLNEIIQAMFKLMPDHLHGEELRYESVNVGELLEEIYTDVFPFVEKRNQRVIIDMVDKLPMIQADRDKLRDILENLCMNAIKFTPDGGIIKIRGALQLGDRISLSVQDQGPGIPESEYPRLFQPFYGGSDVMTHSTGETGYQKRGIGLGLAIVRHFVELHQGTIHVSSSPMGSTFTVTLPVHGRRLAPPGGDAGLHI